MGKLQKGAIAALPLLAIAFGIASLTASVMLFAFHPTRTGVMQAPGTPDTNTDLWQVENIEDAETLLVRRGTEQRRVKLCGITANTEGNRAATELVRGSGGEVAVSEAMPEGLFAFLGQQDETWVGEVWVNAKQEGEELLNGLLILEGAAVADESEWMSCPNQLALQAAEELAGVE